MSNELYSLSPSKELLQFLKTKIFEHNKNKQELLNLLEEYRDLSISSNAEKERSKLVHDVQELKLALSDVNVFLHAERQQVTNLLTENQSLKAELKLSEKKITFLQYVSCISDKQLEGYLRETRKRDILHQIHPKRSKNPIVINSLKVSEKSDLETFLEERLRIVNKHFEVSKKAWDEEKNALLDERLLQKQEAKSMRDQDQAHINLINAKLEESKRLVHDATKRAIEARTDLQKAQNVWLSEKDKLITQLEVRKHRFDLENFDDFVGTKNTSDLKNACEVRHLKKEIATTKRKLKEAEELKEVFESRCRKIEEQMILLREKNEATQAIFKSKLKNVQEVKDLALKQRDRSENLRKQQKVGFANELKLVKEDLRRVVHQFFKLTRFYSENDEGLSPDNVEEMKLATSLARKVHHAIVDAKRNMVKLETTVNEDPKL